MERGGTFYENSLKLSGLIIDGFILHNYVTSLI